MFISTENRFSEKSKGSEFSQHIQYELRDKLMIALETEKCYLDVDLTINSLAKRIHSNREYLSRTIHYFFEKSYTDLINEYRVKEATRLLVNISNGTQTKLNMLEVAHASGFKSTSTFNPAFKKVMGVTPSEYKKRMQLTKQ
ncbi:MAG: helix-turn-helix domain-containing protein [Mariniphaga sp.]|nr:helix-turn-helix domain-containing protein [Mariniphaga sp.]